MIININIFYFLFSHKYKDKFYIYGEDKNDKNSRVY